MANQICRLKVKNWTNAAGTIKHLKRNRNVTSTSCRVCKQSHDICCVRTQQQRLCYRHLPPLLRPWFIVIWGIFEANSCLNRPDVATLCFFFSFPLRYFQHLHSLCRGSWLLRTNRPEKNSNIFLKTRFGDSSSRAMEDRLLSLQKNKKKRCTASICLKISKKLHFTFTRQRLEPVGLLGVRQPLTDGTSLVQLLPARNVYLYKFNGRPLLYAFFFSKKFFFLMLIIRCSGRLSNSWAKHLITNTFCHQIQEGSEAAKVG